MITLVHRKNEIAALWWWTWHTIGQGISHCWVFAWLTWLRKLWRSWHCVWSKTKITKSLMFGIDLLLCFIHKILIIIEKILLTVPNLPDGVPVKNYKLLWTPVVKVFLKKKKNKIKYSRFIPKQIIPDSSPNRHNDVSDKKDKSWYVTMSICRRYDQPLCIACWYTSRNILAKSEIIWFWFPT